MRNLKVLSLLIFFSSIIFFSFSSDILKSTKIDLNGDGKLESISISGITEEGDFVLKVDKISIKGKLNMGEALGFYIVDINKEDKYKEVAVYTEGPSSDDEYLIYWYDGKKIKEVGRISRWPQFLGNGIVLVDDWMGFWAKRDKYVLDNKTRVLKLVPQEFYYVGIEAKVKKSFAIYRTRKISEAVANLKENSKILILICDPSSSDYNLHWYLIKSETGLLGWAKLESFWDKVEGLPWAD